jgi:nicotinamidase-related amidase
MQNTCLLLIDIQNDYFPGGANPLEGSLEASQRASILLEFFRKNTLPIVHIRHVAIQPGATFFLPDTPGVEIHENVRPKIGELTIHKNFPNAFRNTNLLKHLRQNQIEHLVVCGMMTHMCVDATVRAAVDQSFSCMVAEDACATKKLEYQGETIPAHHVHLAFLAALKAAYAKVSTVTDILSSLQEV